MTPIDEVPSVIKRLYQLVGELEAAFPGRPSPPTGTSSAHWAKSSPATATTSRLLPCGTICHDAKTRTGTLVQIKATQGASVALRAEPDHLLVIRINKDGTIEEICNGPGALAWTNCGRSQKNGQSPTSLAQLRLLMNQVPPEQRLPRRA